MLVQRHVFALPSFTTASGRTLKDVRVGYETYGSLNAARDNAIVVCHYFAGTAHAAGRYQESDPLPGWWDGVIGPGKIFDTDRYFVVCSDTLCCLPVLDKRVVTTGPATINPDTGKPYGLDFPVLRYQDLVRVQKALLDSLGVSRLVAVAGPSAGGFQALEWSVEFPDMVPRVVAVVTPGTSMEAHYLAVADYWVRPILTDPAWQNGNYDLDKQPRVGLTEALRIATISSMTESTLRMLGNLDPADPAHPPSESILNEYMCAKRIGDMARASSMMIDANHYLYLVRAGQLFNVEDRLSRAKAKYLFVPVATDTVARVTTNEAAVDKVRAAGLRAELKVMQTPGGHLDGLTLLPLVKDEITAFLNSD
ncbi:MAG: Homoserine O-acetyltransferase [Betaproteobacteria bacterium ADurb.Bin341]|nr:MAG: Homoserine O-acetyltransferase [Betaproteobacteria bacterium ADurb.Bin341]